MWPPIGSTCACAQNLSRVGRREQGRRWPADLQARIRSGRDSVAQGAQRANGPHVHTPRRPHCLPAHPRARTHTHSPMHPLPCACGLSAGKRLAAGGVWRYSRSMALTVVDGRLDTDHSQMFRWHEEGLQLAKMKTTRAGFNRQLPSWPSPKSWGGCGPLGHCAWPCSRPCSGSCLLSCPTGRCKGPP